MIVRCTKKMLELLGGRTVTVDESPAMDDDWYLDLLWIDRRKCLLLAHAGTLFSVFRASITTADLRPLGPYVCAAIETELDAERLPADTLGRLEPDDVCVARTASRSTLGFMNQMTREIRYQVARHRDLTSCDIDAVNNQLRRTLRNRGGYVLPIELLTGVAARRAPTQPVEAARGAPRATWVPSRKAGVDREAPNHAPYHGP